jgi:glutathione synthase/RimK-type ligase-like ATP-grasp enzyme
VPWAVAGAARRFAAALPLRFGAFDFLVRGETPVFLEVNVTGDWRWAEALAGAEPVTLAAARMLCELHWPACRTARDSFDLLGFLSGRPA